MVVGRECEKAVQLVDQMVVWMVSRTVDETDKRMADA
jgi:hypothetical protein